MKDNVSVKRDCVCIMKPKRLILKVIGSDYGNTSLTKFFAE
jgi:hypothetical protein